MSAELRIIKQFHWISHHQKLFAAETVTAKWIFQCTSAFCADAEQNDCCEEKKTHLVLLMNTPLWCFHPPELWQTKHTQHKAQMWVCVVSGPAVIPGDWLSLPAGETQWKINSGSTSHLLKLSWRQTERGDWVRQEEVNVIWFGHTKDQGHRL